MGVYERDRFGFIDEEAELARNAIAKNIPVLGICLGSQIMAHALGAPVTKNRPKEIGAMTVELTPEGTADPLLLGLGPEVSVFQWHGDTFGIPATAVRLASSPTTANQAFRYGRRAYGFQFHVEVTPEMVAEWLAEYREEITSEGLDAEAILRAAERERKRWAEASEIVFDRFVALSQQATSA
jgi:GMP synthase-like glutamine amidotransferase